MVPSHFFFLLHLFIILNLIFVSLFLLKNLISVCSLFWKFLFARLGGLGGFQICGSLAFSWLLKRGGKISSLDISEILIRCLALQNECVSSELLPYYLDLLG